MKKILFVTSISGFLPQFESNDVKILKQMGCEIHYASNFNNPIYTFDRNKLIEEGVILHQIDIEKNPARSSNIKTIKQVKNIIDECNIDIVHCHNPMGGVCARIAARFSKRKPYVIYTAHGFHFYKGAPIHNWLLYYPVEKFLARWTDQIITINSEDFFRAKHFALKKGGKVDIIHGVGVDEGRFKKSNLETRKIELRHKLGVSEDAFVIVTAAELNNNKNQQVVIDALEKIKMEQKVNINDIRYLICGKGPNAEQIEANIQKAGLEKQVKMLGYRTDMPDILECADCFAFPSYREGLGIAAVEALLCGVPLIVSDNRGTREYAIDLVNAVVCFSNSVDEYVTAITDLMTNEDYRYSLARRCRNSAKHFTINEVEKTMKKVYKTWVDR
ncbi:MAG: glycosyltransferase [Pseudobutyrivibrio sp.]|nr:glycosyltransferase [Pseudobutyrivibrio sp.]